MCILQYIIYIYYTYVYITVYIKYTSPLNISFRGDDIPPSAKSSHGLDDVRSRDAHPLSLGALSALSASLCRRMCRMGRRIGGIYSSFLASWGYMGIGNQP